MGIIFDIKKFAVHDGPGIRTTVFLKGCPLRCRWCHNPEGLEQACHLWYFQKKCIGCGGCVSVCPEGALALGKEAVYPQRVGDVPVDAGERSSRQAPAPNQGGHLQGARLPVEESSAMSNRYANEGVAAESRPFIRINRKKCISCGECVDACPTVALAFDGREITARAVADEVLRDRAFYRHSGGGVTLSGGEPTAQPAFALELLTLLKREGLSTAMESSMFCAPDTFRRFLPLLDEVIVDIKLLNETEHIRHTGASNRLILENFRYLASAHSNVLLRIPMIPGITDGDENVRAIARFVAGVNLNIPMELINYNPLAGSKYRLMDRRFELADAQPLSEARLEALRTIIEGEGIRAVRDGV